MEEADGWALAKGAALRQRGCQCVPGTRRQPVEARFRIVLPGSNTSIESIESAESDAPGHHRKQQKCKLVYSGKHPDSPVNFLVLLGLLAQLSNHGGNNFLDVPDDAVIRDPEDGSVGVLVDGNDDFALV